MPCQPLITYGGILYEGPFQWHVAVRLHRPRFRPIMRIRFDWGLIYVVYRVRGPCVLCNTRYARSPVRGEGRPGRGRDAHSVNNII
jgi:hypothetical protein